MSAENIVYNRLPPSRWNHVSGEQNHADCASNQPIIDHYSTKHRRGILSVD